MVETTDTMTDALADPDGSLWTFDEIARRVSQLGNASETLTNVAHLIQRRFASDVCSVYRPGPVA